MRKLVPGIAIAALALAASSVARADCAAELAPLRAKIGQVRDKHRREEIAMLVDKAESDHRKGSEKSCLDAVEHARKLLK